MDRSVNRSLHSIKVPFSRDPFLRLYARRWSPSLRTNTFFIHSMSAGKGSAYHVGGVSP